MGSRAPTATSTGDFANFFVRTSPAAMYRVRWWGVVVTAAVLVTALISGIWTFNHPEAMDMLGTPEQRAEYANHLFADYYTDNPNSAFTAQVFTNNAWIALLCVAFGVAGIFPVYLMYSTALQLAGAGAIMAEANGLDVFFKLIIPHGLLELSAVFVAAGAGLRLFWVMLVPGNRTRGAALGQEGRVTFAVAIGLALALFCSRSH